MWYGVIRILSKIEWWIKFSLKRKDCGCFCPTCRFYDQCRWEAEYIEEVFGEPYE